MITFNQIRQLSPNFKKIQFSHNIKSNFSIKPNFNNFKTWQDIQFHQNVTTVHDQPESKIQQSKPAVKFEPDNKYNQLVEQKITEHQNKIHQPGNKSNSHQQSNKPTIQQPPIRQQIPSSSFELKLYIYIYLSFGSYLASKPRIFLRTYLISYIWLNHIFYRTHSILLFTPTAPFFSFISFRA